MKAVPDYDTNIVVAVISEGTFHWLVTEKEHWFLDYVKWGEAFSRIGYSVSGETGTERFGIEILDESSVSTYLTHQADCTTSRDELADLLLMYPQLSEADDVLDLSPSVLVDFDSRHLVNSFPEPSGQFEKYVPNGWTSEYGDVESLIPETECFWIIGDKNYFAT